MARESGTIVLACADCGLRATLAEAVAHSEAWRIYRDGVRCPDCVRRHGTEGAME